MKTGKTYTFRDNEYVPECSPGVRWEYVEYSDYTPGDLLRGNLWVIHDLKHYHKLEVMGNGEIQDHGWILGTINDLIEA